LISNLPTSFTSEPKWKTTFNISRVRDDLNIEPMPIRNSLLDMIKFIIDAGLLPQSQA